MAACLPYIALAAFADFVHSDAAPSGSAAPVATSGPAVAGAVAGDRQTDASCPVCLWLRGGPRLGWQVPIEAAGASVQSEVAPSIDVAPSSPIPHPTAFRGPPSPTLG